MIMPKKLIKLRLIKFDTLKLMLELNIKPKKTSE